MGKCRICGKKGLFLKLDSQGRCANCKIESEQNERLRQLDAALSNKQKLYDEACASAKTQAHADLESEYARMSDELIKLCAKRDHVLQEFNDTSSKLSSAKSDLEAILKRSEKLRPLAKSIKAALSDLPGDATVLYNSAALDAIRACDLEQLLPDPDLNCMTVKSLASSYKNVRKQIVDVCAQYEKRYTTKTISAMYRLMVLALESEFENILYKLQFGKLESGVSAVRALTEKYFAIATDGNQSIAPTLKRFISQIESLYIQALEIEYEYYVQRERAKEEQRALREQMRQEAEERRQLEVERKKIEAEENKYRAEIERISAQMQHAHDHELEALRARIDELNQLVEHVDEKRAEIINLQNGKAGTVYIISNIGSFGENVFKVGMTRRIEPQDRVNELGDASVPFPFDVHSFIFSQDAPALESALHKELNDRRVNKVNLRKEFFNVSIEELQQIVERIDPTAPFRVTALAEQYRQSQSIDSVPDHLFEFPDEEDVG